MWALGVENVGGAELKTYISKKTIYLHGADVPHNNNNIILYTLHTYRCSLHLNPRISIKTREFLHSAPPRSVLNLQPTTISRVTNLNLRTTFRNPLTGRFECESYIVLTLACISDY